jgi:hypothetical protein
VVWHPDALPPLETYGLVLKTGFETFQHRRVRVSEFRWLTTSKARRPVFASALLTTGFACWKIQSMARAWGLPEFGAQVSLCEAAPG